MSRRFTITCILIMGMLLTGSPAVFSQSGSYLETIFRAGDQGTATQYQEPETSYVIEGDEAPEAIDVPEPTGLEQHKAALQRLQNIVNRIISIIKGKITGITIKVVVIPCERIVPKPEPKPEPQPNDVESLRASIKQKYGVIAADGQGAKWSAGQLKAYDEVLESLPPIFREATQVVYRDGPPPSFAPAGTMGYVIVPQRRVHMLDMSVTYTQNMHNSLVRQLGRQPTAEEKVRAVRNTFKRTLVHEMVHTFQNTYPQLMSAWKSNFWPRGRAVGTIPTSYGRSMAAEDMAESVAEYWIGGRIEGNMFISRSGARMDINRYNFIKNNMMNGKEYKY